MDFLDDGGNAEIGKDSEKNQRFEKGDKNGGYSSFEPQQRAVVLYERFEKIGDQTGYAERQKHVFQDIDNPDNEREYGASYQEPYNAVKGIGARLMWHRNAGWLGLWCKVNNLLPILGYI